MMLMSARAVFLGFLFSSHQRFVAFHAEYPLRRPRILQVLDFLPTASAPKACGTESLVAGKDGEILDLVPARTAAICTVVANERTIAEEEEVGVGIQEGAAGVTAETVNVPAIARWERLSISTP